jgi:hypothetical protein
VRSSRPSVARANELEKNPIGELSDRLSTLTGAFTSRKLYWTVAADFNVIGACTSPWSSGEAPKKGPRFVYKRGSDFFGKQGEQVANALVNKGVTLGAT